MYNMYLVGRIRNNPNLGRAAFDELLYDVVDMNANSGAGKVIKKMVPLLQNVTLSKTQMMACRHGDGKDWWLFKPALDTNMIYKFIFTKDTVYGPYIQGFPEPHFTKWDINGQASFSQDGTKYATGIEGDNTQSGGGWLFVADFDRCSGLLYNPKTYQIPATSIHNPYDSTQTERFINGVAFSPNGRYLYIAQRYNIQQMDLQAADPQNSLTVVATLDTVWSRFQTYTTLYLGPDNKLYIGNWNSQSDGMSVINNPDNGGLACNFCPRCLRFPIIYYSTGQPLYGATSPPNMPNYKLGATSPPCSLAVDNVIRAEENSVSVYPSPTNGRFITEVAVDANAVLYDINGRTVTNWQLHIGKNDLTMPADISAGIYFIRIGKEYRKIVYNP